MKKPRISTDDLQRAIKKNAHKAEKFLKDSRKLKNLLWEFERKVKHVPGIGSRASDVATMVAMVRAYALGEYREIPKNTILSIIGVLIYVVNPMDLIPDSIPGVGMVDDAKAIDLALKNAHKDVEAFRRWRAQR